MFFNQCINVFLHVEFLHKSASSKQLVSAPNYRVLRFVDIDLKLVTTIYELVVPILKLKKFCFFWLQILLVA